ncbi:MAG: zinc ribbon domain-containing protein [Actinobacteria bacterium]|nr:zinc ribbon domain-containing protein [Actinomycetota bacterium]
MVTNCPSCGRDNEDQARFCSGCGGELATTCPSCGADLPADAVFCKSCGAIVDMPPATAAASAAPAAAAATRVEPAPAAAPPLQAGPAGPAGSVPPTPQTGAGRAGGPPRRRPGPALLVIIIVLVVAAAAAAAIYFFIVRDGSDNGTGGKTPTPVASSGGATPSPVAGGFLAAAVGRQGDVLGTVAADGAVKELATTLGPQIIQIAYSPDGKRLACIAGDWKRPELSVVDVAQGTVQRVRIASPAVVAIDSIAWLGPQSLLVAGFTVTPNFQGEDAELLVYDPVSGSAEPVKDDAGVALRGVSVSASADGGKVVYVTYTDQKSDQYGFWSATERLNVLDRASGSVTQLGSAKAFFDVNARSFDDPLISPTGTAVIFRQAGSDVGTSYTVLDINGTTLMPAKKLLFPAGYAWDPSGTKVVFTGQSIKSNGNGAVFFYLFDTSLGGAPKAITNYTKTVVQDLAWSPDGSTIAWAEWEIGKYRSGNLYLLSPSGGDSTRLASWAIMPAWAPGAVTSPSPSPSPSP